MLASRCGRLWPNPSWSAVADQQVRKCDDLRSVLCILEPVCLCRLFDTAQPLPSVSCKQENGMIFGCRGTICSLERRSGGLGMQNESAGDRLASAQARRREPPPLAESVDHQAAELQWLLFSLGRCDRSPAPVQQSLACDPRNESAESGYHRRRNQTADTFAERSGCRPGKWYNRRGGNTCLPKHQGHWVMDEQNDSHHRRGQAAVERFPARIVSAGVAAIEPMEPASIGVMQCLEHVAQAGDAGPDNLSLKR